MNGVTNDKGHSDVTNTPESGISTPKKKNPKSDKPVKVKNPNNAASKAYTVDLKIQGTNNSSIVSKRSVERLYKEKHDLEFFRHFVKKPQRRSPIINRGYWTRMEAMGYCISAALAEKAPKHVIVNLGCGYDPYPFQHLHKHGLTENLIFVDVDYPDLMQIKVDTIRRSDELTKLVGEEKPAAEIKDKSVLMQTGNYIALSCDLRDLEKFEFIFRNLDLIVEGDNNPLILFTAEVSVTYMFQKDADNLLQWCASLPNSRFALLEQIIPAGTEHPFAKTMLAHFDSLQTTLWSVKKYPSIPAQYERFTCLGWKEVSGISLAQFWDSYVPDEKKEFVENVEAFDEWEEFLLFLNHYSIIYGGADIFQNSKSEYPEHEEFVLQCEKPTSEAHRIGAAACSFQNGVILNGGQAQNRESTSLLLSLDSTDEFIVDKNNMIARQYHSLSEIEPGVVLLAGGRSSPTKKFSDCHILKNGLWKPTFDLPEGRFRHCMQGTLLFGGSESKDQWLHFSPTAGWKALKCDFHYLTPYGATLIMKSPIEGILLGGMDAKGNLRKEVYSVTISEGETVVLSLIPMKSPLIYARYGAQGVYHGNRYLLVGGVSYDILFNEHNQVVELDIKKGNTIPVKLPFESYPLLVSHSVNIVRNCLVVAGGGAVCFSFGVFHSDPEVVGNRELKVIKEQRPSEEVKTEINSTVISVEEGTLESFPAAYVNATPTIFRNCDIGPSSELWKSHDYLKSNIGEDTKVSVHIADNKNLNFQSKNFSYQTLQFGELMKLISDIEADSESSKSAYLRSLSLDNPKSEATDLCKDFPGIARDFKLPKEMADFIGNKVFSTPLRISSSKTQIWLHYDVTANVLCQVTGSKRVRMYHPRDVVHLGFPAGESSSKIPNIFVHESCAQAYEVVMNPGDILFIPPMWLHAVEPQTESISVNCFWKDLDGNKYSKTKDIYGNKDLASYESGREGIKKIADKFAGLPADIKEFYLRRLAEELKQM
ncbi:leucine carboxyl methyltransferase 2 [Yarrowia lipolytica]|uniref:tRNA wybutosine-synthesizing protein 4 n=1 Tax=Yarrowia lipolytica TaxID=4952 RepID=A0A371C0U4_YARLL|nr:leucine carboxyl methyltransferase 2 [Yarrowia lipolytica]